MGKYLAINFSVLTFVPLRLCVRYKILENLWPGTYKGGFQDKFAISLIFITFAYSGWNAAVYIGGEIKKQKEIFHLLFLRAQPWSSVYIYALSPGEMSGVLEVGTKSAVSLFGDNISRYFSGAIAIGILSVLSAMIMTGPRVYYAMARDSVFFELFGKINGLRQTPVYAILLQAVIAIIMVITASFDKLLLYIGFTLSLCAMLTVVGMMLLRIKKPDLKRSYKTFGYPVTPLFFILGNLWIIYFCIKSRPITSLFGLGTIGLGILFYLYFKRKNRIAEKET